MVKSGSYEVKQGDIFGRIGQGIGKGIEEQLPKEIERGRLAQGLQSFEKNSGNLNPLQAATQLLSIPGISAEHIYALQPLLQQLNARKEASRYGKELEEDSDQYRYGNPPSRYANDSRGLDTNFDQYNGKPISNQEAGIREVGNQPEKGITNLETEQALLKPNLPPTQRNIRILAGKLQNENPGLFPTTESAELEASKRLISEYDRTEALRNQSKTNDEAKTAIEAEFKKILGDLNADIPSEVRQKYLNQAYDDVASGKSTKLQAANEYGKKALELAKAYTRINTIGSSWFPDAKESKNTINQLGQRFKDPLSKELFSEKLQSSLGLTPTFAKTLSNPVSDNREYNNYLKSVKEAPQSHKNLFSGQYKIAKDLVSHLGPNDSILSGLLELKTKGYNPENVMENIRNLYNSGEINLNATQVRELETPVDARPSFGDIWYFILGGKDKLVEQK